MTKAKLTIQFEDGTADEITLENAIELNVCRDAKQSICFNQTKSGKWVMAFTKPLFAGKKFTSIAVSKFSE